MSFIEVRDVSFSYEPEQNSPPLAVERVSLDLSAGCHLALLGRNGSGKSTLAHLINALEAPLDGIVIVDGRRTDRDEDVWAIRRTCGMVFQNPDNQIVATTVEEDVAFGPENLGIPSDEIVQRVADALSYVGLGMYAQKMPAELSGGQKQKLAIAGILAMKPRCLILDEATSMLDPLSRQSFMELVLRLCREQGLTVLNITHDMKEVLMADRVMVMDGGHILLSGTSAEIFHHVEQIRGLGLDVPAHTAIAYDIYHRFGRSYPLGAAATVEGARQLVETLLDTLGMEPDKLDVEAERPIGREMPEQNTAIELPFAASGTAAADEVLRVENLSYRYDKNATGKPALKQIDFNLRRGELLGIMGHSGSGKSTLVQHLNGLLQPQTGRVTVLGRDVTNKKQLRELRRHVGLLFQYPEHQLFASTVREDIAFGPKKMGCDNADLERRVARAMAVVGLSEDILERSPFELSGGQKRRVAIAGILAMEPEILILDEPAAGLDPAGREEILDYIRQLRGEGVTVILVSHSMEDIARLADRILVLCEGEQIVLDTPEKIFSDAETLRACQLLRPATQEFLEGFRPRFPDLNTACFTEDTAVEALLTAARNARLAAEPPCPAKQERPEEDGGPRP